MPRSQDRRRASAVRVRPSRWKLAGPPAAEAAPDPGLVHSRGKEQHVQPWVQGQRRPRHLTERTERRADPHPRTTYRFASAGLPFAPQAVPRTPSIASCFDQTRNPAELSIARRMATTNEQCGPAQEHVMNGCTHYGVGPSYGSVNDRTNSHDTECSAPGGRAQAITPAARTDSLRTLTSGRHRPRGPCAPAAAGSSRDLHSDSQPGHRQRHIGPPEIRVGALAFARAPWGDRLATASGALLDRDVLALGATRGRP